MEIANAFAAVFAHFEVGWTRQLFNHKQRIYLETHNFPTKLFRLISSLNSVEYEFCFRLEGFFFSVFFFKIIHLLLELNGQHLRSYRRWSSFFSIDLLPNRKFFTWVNQQHMILTTAKIKATDFPIDRAPRTEHQGVVHHALLEEWRKNYFFSSNQAAFLKKEKVDFFFFYPHNIYLYTLCIV